MQAVPQSTVTLALFNLGGGEAILILALALILLGAIRLPGLGRGLGRGFSEFRRASRQVADEVDEAASEAGQSVGGVYGKPAAEALTPDNQVAELYDPAVLQDGAKRHRRWRLARLERPRWWISRVFKAIYRAIGRR